MEVRLKTPEKYRFPAFETLQWYAAKWYTQYLKDHNSKRECISLKLYNGLKFLNNTLRKWINSKDVRLYYYYYYYLLFFLHIITRIVTTPFYFQKLIFKKNDFHLFLSFSNMQSIVLNKNYLIIHTFLNLINYYNFTQKSAFPYISQCIIFILCFNNIIHYITYFFLLLNK